ncbi:MAG: DUF6089 family protein [Bacteroidota bacterium]
MKILSVLVLLLVGSNSNAQQIYLNVFGGVSNYQGDLQDKKFTLEQSHPAFGAGIVYEISNKLFARANITLGKISGDDKKSIKNEARNLNFTSAITDIHLGIEYNLADLYEYPMSPYIFAGISGYHFAPYTTTNNNNDNIFLQPLGTEGQGFFEGRKKYKLNQIAIPFGGGLKLAITDNIRFGFEAGFRKLFTDHLDDVSRTYIKDKGLLTTNNGPLSTELSFRGDELSPPLNYPTNNLIRGNPKSKDWYYFGLLSVNIRMPSKEGFSRKKSANTGCPRW